MIQELINKIKKANDAYRDGKPIMSDSQYDILIDELRQLDPDNDILSQVGHLIADETRKSKLPIEMASMNKIKTMGDINDWTRLKSISKSELVVITPKYDGLSLCVNENTNEAWTRGNGKIGQKSDKHYELIGNKLSPVCRDFDFTYGEVMMSKSTFLNKYSNDFANPRNLVAGLLNSKETTSPLNDCQYIKYGAHFNNQKFTTKQDILEELNRGQDVKVPYHICQISELTEELLISLFNQYSIEYEIDGLIIEINDLNKQSELGRETSSNNPVWARAFKHSSFEQSAQTEIIDIEWNISKNSLLKPVAIVKPINLDGVVVSRCTLNNARFVKDMGLGIGAKVVIQRSGLVIPKIVKVIESIDFVEPLIRGVEVAWNEAKIELKVLNKTDEQAIKKNISFFEILGADNIGEGVIKNLYSSGFKDIKDILNLTKEDLEKLDGFGKRKAKIIYDSIKKSTTNVKLSNLQHATNIFAGLGSKKLELLEHFKEKPTIEEVMRIDGFAEISAKSYIDGYDDFFNFVKDLPISIEEKVEAVKVSNDLEGMSFIFTGVRRPDLVKIIESRGGRECSSVSKNTTHLVCVDKNSSSSKMKKAIDLGIQILDVKDLENLLSV